MGNSPRRVALATCARVAWCPVITGEGRGYQRRGCGWSHMGIRDNRSTLSFFFCFLLWEDLRTFFSANPPTSSQAHRGAKVHPTQSAQPVSSTANRQPPTTGRRNASARNPPPLSRFLAFYKYPTRHAPRSAPRGDHFRWRARTCAICGRNYGWYEDGRRCGASALVVQRVQRVNHVSIVHRLGRSILSLEIDRLARGLLNGKVKVQSMVRASSSQL